MSFICFNGNFFDAGEPVLSAGNRAFKYGDAVFETMLWQDGSIRHYELHFDRLYRSLNLLQIDSVGLLRESLIKNIRALVEKNHCFPLAKVRLEVFRENDQSCSYLIEAEAIEEKSVALYKDWSIVIHPYVRKSCDAYANLKSSNFLPYVMAELYRKEKNADECLVLNAFGNIADGSRTNIFIKKGEEIFTPALHQGCIDGVMRKVVVENLKKSGHVVKQTELTLQMLEEADSVFLTNAILGLRFVKRFGEMEYDTTLRDSLNQLHLLRLRE